MADALRRQVLSVYRRIVRLGYQWEAVDPTHTREERQYILREARTLFRANQHLTDIPAIVEHLAEGESRMEIGECVVCVCVELSVF